MRKKWQLLLRIWWAPGDWRRKVLPFRDFRPVSSASRKRVLTSREVFSWKSQTCSVKAFGSPTILQESVICCFRILQIHLLNKSNLNQILTHSWDTGNKDGHDWLDRRFTERREAPEFWIAPQKNFSRHIPLIATELIHFFPWNAFLDKKSKNHRGGLRWNIHVSYFGQRWLTISRKLTKSYGFSPTLKSKGWWELFHYQCYSNEFKSHNFVRSSK